ncbi:hypothetical protein EGY31_16335 [Burkholderia multivorans]|uniref:hypothetical protein n=1 Tax=Burkholderia ubonensis TaxID=101571 RepID=UPI000F71D4CF|nr:hypothetical protein [Burkholderia ubonensis]AYZ64877.1 hypothetical protein EGY31_16335 [Burkholderia multivorans]VWB11135.1 hypothetical protein BUB20358_00343 [Burkholderia ubonensis]
MNRIRIVSVAMAASIGLALAGAPIAFAQDAATEAAPMAKPTPKEVSKAQRKAARKAAREKRNQDLGAIEKDGYRLTYPQSPQNGAGKADGAKATNGAAPSPGQ